MRPRCFGWAALVFLASLLVPVTARTQCPEFSPRFMCAMPAGQSADSLYCALGTGQEGALAYDLTARYFSVWGHGIEFGLGVQYDTFQIVGLPAGTPVTFTMRAHAWYAWGPVVNPLGAAWGMDFSPEPHGHEPGTLLYGEIWVNPGDPPWAGQETQDLTFTRTAGQAFFVGWWFSGNCTLPDSILMRVRFDALGLPPGASLVSCTGLGGLPTPVAPTTWGAIKRRYR